MPCLERENSAYGKQFSALAEREQEKMFDAVATVKRLILTAMAVVVSQFAAADGIDLSYTARIVNDSGAPLAGPIDAAIRFYDADNNQLGNSIKYQSLALTDGILQLSLNLDATQQWAIFGDGTYPVFLELEAGGKVY